MWFLGVYSDPVLFLGRIVLVVVGGGSGYFVAFLLASCDLGDPWQLSHCVSYTSCLVIAYVSLFGGTANQVSLAFPQRDILWYLFRVYLAARCCTILCMHILNIYNQMLIEFMYQEKKCQDRY